MRAHEPTVEEVKASLRDAFLPLLSTDEVRLIIQRFVEDPKRPRQPRVFATQLAALLSRRAFFLRSRTGIDELVERRPRELERLRFDVLMEVVRPLVASWAKGRGKERRKPKGEKERAVRLRASKDRYELKRSAGRGKATSIEEQFRGSEGSLAGVAFEDYFRFLFEQGSPLNASCLDQLFLGGEVPMAAGPTSLQSLFAVSRKLFPRTLPYRRKGRVILYGLPAVLTIMRSMLKTKKWLANPTTRKTVLARIIQRAEEVATPEVAAKVRATLSRYL